MIDFQTFEAFEGKKPDHLLDTHPDGTYLAMQVTIDDVYPAAIWSTETKRLVWSPEDAYALSWLREGTQLAALQWPPSSETCRFALYSWPQGSLLQECFLRFPLGFLFDLIISPTNTLVVCQWTDQSEFGFEFIALSDHDVVHLSPQGYLKSTTNRTTRPVFQPGGPLWVCAYQDNPDWWRDEEAQPLSHSSAQESQREQLGALLVFHSTRLLGEIPLIVTVPAEYHPPSVITPDTTLEEMGYLSEAPVFLDADHVLVRLPSGESSIHDLSTMVNEGLFK